MTTLVDLVAKRIAARVPTLAGAIEYIAELAALVEAGALPQRDLAAFVVPLGFDDRGGSSAANAYTQTLADMVGVVICIKARGDVKAKSAVPKVDEIVNEIVDAVAGWTPNQSVGVFRVLRGRLIPGASGLIVYQLDFELLDQLRIVT
ncbi:hypothetical protein HU230_0007945 [Bradyrhizobium quebecense]|uniref:Uncharacterized protein n=1 Tax=Bradyrhizobium quebecense TaxID=2748629 RepID=A0A973WPD9_9BRAD|nr:hypothetical protein [Bradyrhizobium quebecense]UGA45958.1 hypothetical protein HU230_0007945 [Bradyrhizobium quebecense]